MRFRPLDLFWVRRFFPEVVQPGAQELFLAEFKDLISINEFAATNVVIDPLLKERHVRHSDFLRLHKAVDLFGFRHLRCAAEEKFSESCRFFDFIMAHVGV